MNTVFISLLASAVLVLAATAPVSAADGDPLYGFGTDGEYPGHGFYANPWGANRSALLESVLPAADGRIYLVGSVQTGDSSWRLALRRLTRDGYPDYDFAEGGLRTYVPPCPDGRATTGAMDSQGRIWMAIGGCGDFIAYRFTPAGDVDTGVQGTGVVQVAFDLGGDDSDYPSALKVTDDDGLIIAGYASTNGPRVYALAQVSASGQPRPGFGAAGKVVVETGVSVTSVTDVFEMEDGRIVLSGRRLWNGNTEEYQVLRLQPNGLPDVGFGADGPGFSRRNLAEMTNFAAATTVGSALMERDGSVLVVGMFREVGVHSGDFFVARWLPDGLPDLALGQFGVRRFPLDFGLPDPLDASNLDRAYTIARQSNGHYLLAGYSADSEGNNGMSLLRLRPGLQVDSTFGDNGKVRFPVPISVSGWHNARAEFVIPQPGRILVGGTANTGLDAARIVTLLGLELDLLFADGYGD